MRFLSFLTPLTAGLLCSHAALAQYAEQPPPSGAYGGEPAPQQQAQPPMEAGGLAPPPSTSPESPGVVQTEAKLDEAQKKDSGRGLEWIWLNAEFGFEHLGLQTFHANQLVDASIVGTTQTGLMYGAGLGVRLVFITLGARFRFSTFDAFDLWTLNGELGLRIPLGKLEPHFSIGAGFASVGSFASSDLGGVNRDQVHITGYDVRAGGGLDYYVTPIFSVGAAISFEMLGLTRPGVTFNEATNAANGGTVAQYEVYRVDRSSLGSAFTGTLVLGLHF
jgi:hypothetical protein